MGAPVLRARCPDGGPTLSDAFHPSPFGDHAEVEAKLLDASGPFATELEAVGGGERRVFRERLGSLREMLAGSAGFGAAEYMVYEEQRLSFADHLAAVASMADALRTEFGVGPGDRVAILAANRPEWVISWWAAVSLGAIAVGLNGWWVRDEIRHGLADCRPKLLVGDAKRLERLRPGDLAMPAIEIETGFASLLARRAELPDTPIDEDDPASILYTSGTTGRPKGVVNTHRNLIALNRLHTFHGLRLLMIEAARNPDAAPPARPNCTLINSPLFHVSGLYTGAVTLLAGGVKTVWMAGRFDPVRVMELIEREGVTSWGPMGAMAHRVVTHPDVDRYDLSSVRQIGSGGAPIGPELQERMRAVFPNARRQMGLGYGLTEASGMATINFGRELEERPDSVGRALPTVDVEIRDEAGSPVPEGVEGEIHLRSPIVMQGYWEAPESSAESLLPGGWLRTGDWGRLSEGYLYVNSRKRDLILRGGENVYPAEIENRLMAHPDVDEAAVVGVAHEELGQEVKAFVVPRPGAGFDPEALAAFVGEALAYYKVPSQWAIHEGPLPRNAAGKVMKPLLLDGGESPFHE